MAIIDIWIQLENHAWDVCPNWPMDRTNAEDVVPLASRKQALLRSPVTGKTRVATVYKTIPGEALILRRYTAEWAAPDDRKINPWDLNETDPTDAGTMGTIPGATLACSVGDVLRVHFRNLDMRRVRIAAPWESPDAIALLPAPTRTHSLHAHGLTFAATFDGAYPLSPPDRDQPVLATERALWQSVGANGRFKQGDRVPPGATFVYQWEARGAPSAGVWMYHDHSIADMENTARGAVGMIVVHNPADKEGEVDITASRLPEGSWTGSLVQRQCLPAGLAPIGLLPTALGALDDQPMVASHDEPSEERHTVAGTRPSDVLNWGDVRIRVEVGEGGRDRLREICFDVYRPPPDQALFLLLFHELPGVGMCINGRKYLGNAPTLVAGPNTRMRFGIVGLGDSFHTFHIHGHRWVARGPSGKTSAAIEGSAQVEPVSTFEDAKVFGPGSSFAFTIEEGKGLLRADPPIGEWHMHCHVPGHMMDGMIGSLLIVDGGELVTPLPVGRADPSRFPPFVPQPSTLVIHKVKITADSMQPIYLKINRGEWVEWTNVDDKEHDVHAFNEEFRSPVLAPGRSFAHQFRAAGKHPYDCSFHKHQLINPPQDTRTMDPEIEVLAGGAPAPPVAPAAVNHDVSIGSAGFTPASLTIKAGDTVTWTNKDMSLHTVTSDDHAWTSPNLPGGTTWSKSFPQSGPVPYHCHIHHEMTAQLTVLP